MSWPAPPDHSRILGYEATKRALTPAGSKTPSTGVYLASGELVQKAPLSSDLRLTVIGFSIQVLSAGRATGLRAIRSTWSRAESSFEPSLHDPA